MTHFVHIPDEILCKIFEYLSPFDALYCFTNLNNRFNRLLTPFKRQIDLTSLSYQKVMFYMDTILPMITKEESLSVIKIGNTQTPGQIELFNNLVHDKKYRNYFDNINEVLIESPRLNELQSFVESFLLSLTKLGSLSISIDYILDEHFHQWKQLIIDSIFSVSTLVKLSIEMPSGLVLSRLSNTAMLDSLVDVTLSVTLVTDLLILIKRIPNVKYLSIRIVWWTSGDGTLIKMLHEIRSNDNQISFLNSLQSFHLAIDSTITLEFEHLEQVLGRILNSRTTSSFTFILRNCSNHTNELAQLIDGQRWERLLSLYSSLTKFGLFVRITGCLQIEEEESKLNTFKSKYFQEKNWTFSYFKHSPRDNIIFYSVPYNNKELFDMSISDYRIFDNFPINYALNLLVDQTNNPKYQFSQSTFQFILNYFPSVRKLHLVHFNINPSIIKPINIPSLHTLSIQKWLSIDLPYIMELLPLINTLIISYRTIYDRNKSLE